MSDQKQKLKVVVTAADCRIETMRPGGNGGQNANKRDTAVRITHIASGAVGESREERSQLQNKHIAWKRMANHPKMRAWLDARLRALEEGFASTEAKVEEAMKPENLKIETGPEAAKCAPAEASCDAEAYGPNVTRAHEGRGQGRGGL